MSDKTLNNHILKEVKGLLRDMPKYLHTLQEYAKKPLPPELQDVNRQSMSTILANVGTAEQKIRPYSPLVKGVSGSKHIIPIDSGVNAFERKILKDLAKHIYNNYGEPSFTCVPELSEKNLAVKQWNSLALFGPKVTAGSSERRIENLKKYQGRGHFKPDQDVLMQAVQLFLDMANMPRVEFDFSPSSVKSIFAAHNSNVGWPWFAKETGVVGGKSYRDLSVEKTDELNKKYGASGMAAVPAIIIGRDQPGGIDLDKSKKYTLPELINQLDKVPFKPSKARVVGAIARVVNNNINPIVNAVIHNEQFLANPIFSGFLSRENRLPLYKRAYEMAKKHHLLPVNVDFDAFDTSCSAEMMAIGLKIIENGVNPKGAPDKLFDVAAAVTIYTKAIYMDPESGSLKHIGKVKAIPSGVGYTGLLGYIIAAVSGIYALIKVYSREFVEHLIRISREANTFAQVGLGDDLLGYVKQFEDLGRIASVIESDFGMHISVDGVKTSVGIDFLQEYYNGKTISYPIGRVMRSALYTERPKGLGECEGVMSWYSMIYNIRTNSDADVRYVTAWIMSLDKSKLGWVDGKTGAPQTHAQFRAKLATELKEHDQTAKQVLGDGDPAKENKFTPGGDFTSSYLDWCGYTSRREL